MPWIHRPVPQLRRRRLGVVHLVVLTVAATAPLLVLGGTMTTTFAVTGIAGAPLSFLVLAVSLALFAVGYGAMSRHVVDAGAFYSYLAKGLGRTWAVAGAFVAVLSYNAIQLGLYGLLGAGVANIAAGSFALEVPWWVGALIALVLVGALGLLRIDVGAALLAVLVGLEIGAVVLYDVAALDNPADGAGWLVGLSPEMLFVPGVAAVLAFGVAAFIGLESAAIYSEECRNPRVTVRRATFAALAVTGILYTLSAWAMTVTVGPTRLYPAAAEHGSHLVFGALAMHWSPATADIVRLLFLTSVFGALLSFHHGVARYLFALGRERVLPGVLDRVGERSGGPVAGSLGQTAFAALGVLAVAVTGADPIREVFTWSSGVGAVGIVLIMCATSAAVVGYFRKHAGRATVWQRLIAPAAATVVLFNLVVLLVVNFDILLGIAPDAPLRWVLPGIVVLVAATGAAWAEVLRLRRPDVYAGIGRTALVPDDDTVPVLDLPTPPLR